MYRRAGVYTLLIATVCAACLYLGGIPRRGSAPNIDGNRRPAPMTYVAFGDSTGIGLGARNGGGYVDRLFTKIRRTHPEAKLVNLSAAGATAAQVLQSQVPRLGDVGPTVVTLGIGANDVLAGVDEGQFAEDYERIVTQIVRAGPPVIMVMTIPDIDSAPAMRTSERSDIAARVESLNKRIRDIASRHGLLLVDLHDAGTREELSRPEPLFAGRFSPVRQGICVVGRGRLAHVGAGARSGVRRLPHEAARLRRAG